MVEADTGTENGGRLVYRESVRTESLKEHHIVNALAPFLSLKGAMDRYEYIECSRKVKTTEALFRTRTKKKTNP